MIVFAAFTPHSPLLLPTIGKEARKRMSATISAMEHLSDALRDAAPETVVTISAHAIQHDTAFSANLHEEYVVDLQAFGDMSTSDRFVCDLSLIDSIQRGVRHAEIPFTIDSDPTIDYGSAVPLTLLNVTAAIVPISYARTGSAKQQFAFGRVLREVLEGTSRRVAVIASGDLAHSLTSDAPAGFRPEGALFDQAVLHAIAQSAPSQLLQLDESMVEQATECAYRPLLVLMGILDGLRVRPQVHAYECPFGVGYLTAEFHLS